MNDLDRTLRAITAHGWTVVLLAPRLKKPAGSTWQMTRNLSEVRRHLGEGGNLGLVCGSESSVAVLDFDDMDAAREMFNELGPLPITVITGSGKWHAYVQWLPDLPAKFFWRGQKVGEVQRGPMQQVVMPPSIHPNGKPYTWNLRIQGVGKLPQDWLDHLLQQVKSPQEVILPDWLEPYTDLPKHILEQQWEGPPPEELVARALRVLHRVRPYHGGAKGQCPGCAAEGHDKHHDNAIVFVDGRWGCAWAKDTPAEASHKRAIGEALGIVSIRNEILGEELRDITIEDM